MPRLTIDTFFDSKDGSKYIATVKFGNDIKDIRHIYKTELVKAEMSKTTKEHLVRWFKRTADNHLYWRNRWQQSGQSSKMGKATKKYNLCMECLSQLTGEDYNVAPKPVAKPKATKKVTKKQDASVEAFLKANPAIAEMFKAFNAK